MDETKDPSGIKQMMLNKRAPRNTEEQFVGKITWTQAMRSDGEMIHYGGLGMPPNVITVEPVQDPTAVLLRNGWRWRALGLQNIIIHPSPGAAKQAAEIACREKIIGAAKAFGLTKADLANNVLTVSGGREKTDGQ